MESKSNSLCALCFENVNSGANMHNVCRNLLEKEPYLDEFVAAETVIEKDINDLESSADSSLFSSLGDLTWTTPHTVSPTCLLQVSLLFY